MDLHDYSLHAFSATTFFYFSVIATGTLVIENNSSTMAVTCLLDSPPSQPRSLIMGGLDPPEPLNHPPLLTSNVLTPFPL